MPRTQCPDGRTCRHYSADFAAGPEWDGCFGDCARTPELRMTKAEIEFAVAMGMKPSPETAVAVNLVWEIAQAKNLLDRVSIAKEALKAASQKSTPRT